MDALKSIEQKLAHIEDILLSNKIVLTFNEAAKYCGLSRSYLYKLTSAGLIPHFKPNGKQLYFKKADVDTWLLRNEVSTNDVVDRRAVNHITLNKKY